MAAPSVVQSATATGAGTATVTLNSVVSGATIVLCVLQGSSATRTYSATNYTVAVANNPARAVVILYRENCPSGTNSITVNANTGTETIRVVAIELSPCTLEDTDSFTDGSSVTLHYSASPGGIDVAIDAIAISAGQLNASAGTLTKAAAYTEIGQWSLTQLVQYYANAAGLVAERGEYTSSISRFGTSAIAGFTTTGGGGGQTVNLSRGVETDIARALTIVNPRTYSLSRPLETDVARSLSILNPRAYSLGRATETDVARAQTVLNPRSYQLGRPLETDVARSLTVVNPRSYSLGRATETDVARSLTIVTSGIVSLGRAVETDVARVLTIVNPRTYALSRPLETDVARSVSVLNPRRYTLGRAVETDVARSLSVSQGRVIAMGRSTEVDAARALTVRNPRTYALGRSTEVDLARSLGIDQAGSTLGGMYYFTFLAG